MRVVRRAWLWFDDLTGFSRTLWPVIRHPVPPARRTAWFYVFGSATLTAFLVQVVTGISLASSYVTSSGEAYDSLQFITDTRLGSITRGIHYFGASAMIILIGVHVIRVYLMGAYKFPRQLTWLTGAGLLLFTLGMAFTGQLLRWDQIGFWTAVIAAEQAGRVPLVGNWVGHFILAGDTAGGATLSRFFAAHVFFIPACIFLFVGLHLYLVVFNGISEPPQAGRPVDPHTYRQWYARLLEREGHPFWPDAAWKDIIFAILVITTILACAILVGPPPLGKPPDPALVQASPRPDWYFMWYFAVLSLIPKWSERWVIFLGPLVFGLVLILLPFLARRGERSPIRRPWAFAIVAAVVIIIGHYWRVGDLAPWSPRLSAEPLLPQIIGATSGPVADGAKLFHDKGCEYCHTISGMGGIRGPDLTYVGDRMTRAQILTRVYSGAENMPSYVGNIKLDELNALLSFLVSRQHPLFPGSPVTVSSRTR